ncbi:glycosyltransferase [Paenibacillus psychroresistens]|uniref:Glycosyltransferase n=1 Tax=Paenibacillus psychroresistens TaxID=1778678 RepID=A0A6B8RPU0_9BACL|nr:glycosyltransferase [Paenibacillus psychroresistens]QGQ97523.1 glycosyltransferase [Paenibacillus psychroresistens]
MHDKDIRVLMMLDAFDIGGTETHVLSLTNELLKQGVSVFVAGVDGPLKNIFNTLPCEIYNYQNNKQGFEEWIQINKINLIHAHLESSGRYAVRLSHKLNIPLIYTIHGFYYDIPKLQYLLIKYFVQPIIIGISKPIQKWLEKEGVYSIYVPNGIDMNEFHAKQSNLRVSLNIPEKSKVILYASRLEDKKYEICKQLLKAFENKLLKEFPNIHFLVAGGGKKTELIKKHIYEKIQSKRIQYIGNRVDMPDLFSISDFVVGTGRVALEAIFCERPVIAIGSAGIFGLVKPENFKKALEYYFCDHKCYQPLNQINIINAVRKGLLSEGQSFHFSKVLKQQVQKRFEASLVTKEILEIYKKKLQEEEVL